MTLDRYTRINSHSTAAKQFADSVVCIDPGVDDWQMLADGVTPGHQVVVLDKSTPPLEQMTDSLQPIHQNGTATELVHIISHGKPGALVFSSGAINKESLLDNESLLSFWNNTDVYLYGCDVAAGESGEEFLTQFAGLTGAEIVASNDRTGSSARGGDWDLEWRKGTIRSD